MLLAHFREVMDRHKVDANTAWTKRQEAVEKGEAEWLFGVEPAILNRLCTASAALKLGTTQLP